MSTVWVQTDRYDEQLRVLRDKPQGRIGWGTEEAPAIGEPAECGHAYVVIVTYTTGSTFGSESGNTAVACVTHSAEDAMRVRKLIEENAKLSSPQYTINVDGVEIYCGAWTGYFECIDSVHVELVEVTDS